MDDWKIGADHTLKDFQLFKLNDDRQEKNSLAEKHPDRFEEMKATLLAVDAEVLADGPD